jgi:signal transduction histidine kinase
MSGEKQKKLHPTRAIREAIDFYPGGLCFSAMDGRPILVNKTMNALIFRLTGSTVMNANTMWDDLEDPKKIREGERLNKSWFSLDPDEIKTDNRMIFLLPDGSVWRFQRQVMSEEAPGTVQIEASEITELYRLSEKLYEDNIRLASLHERQRNLLANILQINQDKELLATKMRVHDDLGRCLIATRKALSEKSLSAEAAALSKGWEDAIRDLTNIPLAGKAAESSPETELLQVAAMIGCRIDFIGEQPRERRVLLLLYAAVREALTNAVRHAGADCLTVSMKHTRNGFHAEISSNGIRRTSSITEGNGLGNLRRRLEQEGASLEIRCSGGVVLAVDIPEEESSREGTK